MLVNSDTYVKNFLSAPGSPSYIFYLVRGFCFKKILWYIFFTFVGGLINVLTLRKYSLCICVDMTFHRHRLIKGVVEDDFFLFYCPTNFSRFNAMWKFLFSCTLKISFTYTKNIRRTQKTDKIGVMALTRSYKICRMSSITT